MRLRIYQLSDVVAFQQASFRELWLQDSSLLGSALLKRTQLVLKPDQSVTETLKLNRQCRYLGVVAISRNMSKDGWRLIEAVPRASSLLPMSASIVVRGDRIYVQHSKE